MFRKSILSVGSVTCGTDYIVDVWELRKARLYDENSRSLVPVSDFI